MGFKIGDRVQRNDEGVREYYGPGTVVACKPSSNHVTVRHDTGGEINWFDWGLELVPIAPRGPKPLTLTGGRPRFTVRQGQQLVRVRVTAPVSNVRVAFIAVR